MPFNAGDPAIYSTYTYLSQKIEEHGGHTEMVSGVPSFVQWQQDLAFRWEKGRADSYYSRFL